MDGLRRVCKRKIRCDGSRRGRESTRTSTPDRRIDTDGSATDRHRPRHARPGRKSKEARWALKADLVERVEARKKNDDPTLSHRLLAGPTPAGDDELTEIIAELRRLKAENEKLEAEGREEESVRRQLEALSNERRFGNKQLSERRRTDALYKGQLAEKEKELRELQAPSPVPPTLPIGG